MLLAKLQNEPARAALVQGVGAGHTMLRDPEHITDLLEIALQDRGDLPRRAEVVPALLERFGAYGFPGVALFLILRNMRCVFFF
jgi:hypothetical protein